MTSVDKSADLATKLNRSSCSQDDDEEDSSMPYCEPTYKWNVFSWALLWFMNGAIGDAHRRKKERLEVKDTLRLPLDMRCEHLTESFQALWYRYRDDRLRWFKIFGCLLRWELVIGALGEIIYAVVVSGLPFLLQRFVQQHAAEQSLWLTASLIIILCYIRTVFGNSALTASVRASMISRATLVGAMGQKTLRLSSASRQVRNGLFYFAEIRRWSRCKHSQYGSASYACFPNTLQHALDLSHPSVDCFDPDHLSGQMGWCLWLRCHAALRSPPVDHP